LVVEQSAAGAALRDVDMPVDIPATGCANAVTLRQCRGQV